MLLGFKEDCFWVGTHDGVSVWLNLCDLGGILCGLGGRFFGGEECSDGFALDDAADVSWDFEVEYEEWDVAFLAHGEGGHVHDA